MEELPLQGVIGLSGSHSSTLHLTSDGKLIAPLGSALVLRDKDNLSQQSFLTGHTHEVTCAALSRGGSLLATGQLHFQGVEAPVLIHDLKRQEVVRTLALHKAKVQAVGFSCDDRYVATLGGEDDGNLALWDVATGAPLAGSPAAPGFTSSLAFFHRAPHKLVTAGQSSLQIWEFDAASRKLRPQGVVLGASSRNFTTLAIDPDGKLLYAGTSTGDVVQVNLERGVLRNSGPAKGAVSLGITSLWLLGKEKKLVCGGGGGTLCVLAVGTDPSANPRAPKKFATVASAQVSQHAVTSIVLDPTAAAGAGARHVFYCATAGSELLRITLDLAARTIDSQLLQTAHCSRIHGLALPHGYGEVCATGSRGDIRVWHISTLRELLRISVPNLDCTCLAFAQDGKSILSGWSDGKIRAFGPQSGKLLFTIHDAHPRGVTALAGTPDSSRVVSGGEDGTVRVWRIGRESQVMEHSMKEHKAAINCIVVKEDGTQCATASTDGSTIIWNLRTCHRITQLLDSTFFKAFCYHPEGGELVTAGTDKRITYWDGRTGEVLRRLEATQADSVNSLALSGDGRTMVSGCTDGLVKVWGFDDGRCCFVGKAHSAAVMHVQVTFDRKHIVSVGADGALMVWRYREPAGAH